MKDKIQVLTEDTRFNLKFNNLWLMGAFLVSFTFAATIIYIQLQTVIQNQKELTQEFRQWKTQAETRLGTVESNQNTVISYVESHLQVKIR